MSATECGEAFYGYSPPWVVEAMSVSWSVPRFCTLPEGHGGRHWLAEDDPRPAPGPRRVRRRLARPVPFESDKTASEEGP